MTDPVLARSVTHDTFTIDRHYPVPVERVFSAWSDPAAKGAWFAADEEGWRHTAHEMDFRIGGTEHATSTPPDGGEDHVYNARYIDIVDNARIIFSYDMHLGETRISASLATVQFRADGDGTLLTFTEQGAFLDGHDRPAERKEGTEFLLDALGRYLGAETRERR